MQNIKVKQSELNEPKKLVVHYMTTLVDVARESFLILDSDLRVISANPVFYQNFKVSPEQTENVLLYELGNGQWNIPELKRLMEGILPLKKVVKDYAVTHVFETIGKKTILLNARQIDTVQLIVLAMEDITVRKDLEDKLAEYTRELEAKVAKRTQELEIKVQELEKMNKLMIGREIKMADLLEDLKEEKNTVIKVKDEQLMHEANLEHNERDFVSVASHQMLTPLSLISGYISMLVSGKLGHIDADAKNYLEESFKGTERMSALVKELLATSRIESGNIKIQNSSFDVSSLVKKVVADLKSKWTAKGLTINVPEEVKLMVLADKEHTRQVLTNILDNAIKYTEKGSITMEVSSKDKMGQVKVSDTGIGIDKNTLPNIFEKFFMSKNWVSKQSQSHGLGLYISKLLLEKMSGNIEVESKVGKGSTFTISLPLAKNNGKNITD